MSEHFDVLIIGAGVSGIGVACHLARECPNKTFAILERRKAIGGTWDLFRYPGIRSDSDMMTFGFGFRPWTAVQTLADGTSIRNYVNDTAREYGVAEKVRFGLKITKADWSSAEKKWTLTATHEESGETRVFTCAFLVSATGYYNYDRGYLPSFPGEETFKGQRVHPQFWPEDLDYKNKKVVVIGSGATAVTLIPSMADEVAHITMLQRSPGYILPLPGRDALAKALRGWLPASWIYKLARMRNLKLQRFFYKYARKNPEKARKFLLGQAKKRLPEGYDMRHFTPSYMPWDERLCAVPDGDLFRAIRKGKASVVTDSIERFVEDGILLKSGQKLEADIIVTATGLELQLLGGVELRIDGQPYAPGKSMMYKATLVQDVPNFAVIVGYTNASWTLKVDLAAEWLCKLLHAMDQRGAKVVTPHAPEGEVLENENVFGALQSGYVKRGEKMLLRQGKTGPWRVAHNYEFDKAMLREVGDDSALTWSP